MIVRSRLKPQVNRDKNIMRNATDRADESVSVSGGYLSFAVSTTLKAIGGAQHDPGDPIYPTDPVRG